jgi:HKD family nuclease
MQYLDWLTGAKSATLKAWLLPRLDGAALVGLRTGFFTVGAAELIQSSLARMLESSGQLYVVLGGQPEQTDPAALRVLADLAARFPTQAKVYLATPEGGLQHAKTYYVRGQDGRSAAYVGSGNLTRGGLETNQEAAVVLEGHAGDDSAAEAVLEAIRAWADHPAAKLVTSDVATAFGQEVRAARIGSARRPGAADPTWRLEEMLPGVLDLIEAIGSEEGRMSGVPTGFRDLDALTNGLQPGSLTVIGGRPSLGKSVLLLDICRSAAIKHSLPAALFSLEMTSEEINMRLLSAEARVPLHAMRTGQMGEEDWKRLARRMTEVAAAPLYINDTGALTARGLCDEATRLVRDQGVKLVAIDYLQLVTPNLRSESREREVSDMTRQLKALALDLRVPVVVAAQLNRGPEQRIDRRPILADFRESDAIAQAADLVILLHREDVYEPETPRAGEADFIIGKNRNGPTAIVTVAFQGHYARFVDMVMQ